MADAHELAKAVRKRIIDQREAWAAPNADESEILRQHYPTLAAKVRGVRGLQPNCNFKSMKLIAGLKAGKCGLPDAKRALPIEDSVVDATISNLLRIVADRVRFQRLVGCRPSEVSGLKPRMVDRTYEIWEIRLFDHKTAHHGLDRTIFVGPHAQAVLLPYLLRDADSFCFDPSAGERKRRQEMHAARTRTNSHST